MTSAENTKEEAAPAASSIFVTSYDDLAKAILAPIAKPFDEDIEDHPDFDEVSDELMKRGTLSHGSIDWSLLEGSSLALLQNVQKSIAVVEALFLAHMNRKTRGALASCLRGLDAYLSLSKEQQHPQEERRFELILRRTCKLFDLDNPPGTPGSEAERLEESLKRLCKNELLLNYGLTKGFRLLLERFELEKKQQEQVLEQKVEQTPTAAAKSANGAINNAKQMDARTFKRTTADICRIIFQQNPSLPYIYQLRRFACWQEITSAPQIKTGDKTIIPPVSVDTCDKYHQAFAESTVDIAIIHQLETTLFSMPFWFEGQYLAAQLALKADHTSAANAILESTQHFVSRVPELRELCFEDGTPFIEGPTADWLNSKPKDIFAAAQKNDEQQKKTLSDFTQNPTLATKWNGEYKSYKSPRQKAFMELGMLGDLAKTGFSELVSDQTKRLQSSVEEMPITDWDPEFFQRSAALIRKGRK